MLDGPARVAVDIGGTFTDLVLLDPKRGRTAIAKTLSTPPDYSDGVVKALRQADVEPSEVDLFVHGTTAHLNALLERRGPEVVLVTTEGFADVYKMGRGNRVRIYDLHYRNPLPLVPRRRVVEVRERIDARGRVITPLTTDAVDRLCLELGAQSGASVAVCLLHSYANPTHEVELASVLGQRFPSKTIYPSSEVCREWREYERTSTAITNAFVSPILAAYLGDLRGRLERQGFTKPIFLMQSNGGMIESAQAECRGALTLMSGPVGGAVGSKALGRQICEPNIIFVDMGGTSFDFGLLRGGELATVSERTVAGFPVLAPSIDVRTIGAGGGSIAWTESGALRVGPQSAGAAPGPACYGQGGTEPTVTDANVVLGRIAPEGLLGGSVRLSAELASEALARIAGLLGIGTARLAEGIVDVVNAKMANAIRSITIGRGIDPREFTLVAYGGAGPLHAAALAEELGIRRAVVPTYPGVFSARGMACAEVRHERSQTLLAPMNAGQLLRIEIIFLDLQAEVAALQAVEGIRTSRMAFRRSLDMRYVGQEYFINVPLPEACSNELLQMLRVRFDEAYEQRYGHRNLAEDVEIVNVRLEGVGRFDDTDPDEVFAKTAPRYGVASLSREKQRAVIFAGETYATRVLGREEIGANRELVGPAVVEELTCTTLVPPQWVAHSDEHGNLVLEHHGDAHS